MFVHLQPDVLLFDRPKALEFNPNRVIPAAAMDEIVSAVVGLGLAHDTGALRGGLHVRAGYDRPVLSDTVPEKLPLAWPYRSGQMGNTSEQNTTSSAFLVSIEIPRAVPDGEAIGTLLSPRTASPRYHATIPGHEVNIQDFLCPGRAIKLRG